MNKRGFLFTFITIFLLFSLVALTFNYMERNKDKKETIADLSYSNRISYLKQNIVSDFFSMLDIQLEHINRREGEVVLEFRNFSTFTDSSRYIGRLERMEEFTEGKFSDISNAEIELYNIIPEFEFYPYNTTFLIDSERTYRGETENNPDEFHIFCDDHGRLNRLVVEMDVNETNLTVIEEPTPDAAGVDIGINITSGNKSLYNFTGLLNSTEVNEFEFELNDSDLDLLYGHYDFTDKYGARYVSDGVFHMNEDDMEVHIKRLAMNFTERKEKAVLRATGTVNIE